LRLHSTIRRVVGSANGRLRFQSGQGARDRLDGEAEIIGDVLARHGNLDLLDGSEPLGQIEQERGHAFLRGLGEQQDVVLHAPQFTRGKGPKPTRHVPVGICERHQRAALHNEDHRVGNGLGRKMMLVVYLDTEDVARQIDRQFIGFVRDLTEHHEREQLLHEVQSELLHMSRLSTMGQMASTLAHELNQPLAAITNYLQGSRRLLEHAPDDRSIQLREALDKAGDQALRTGQIIRRLRDFVARGETEWRIESIKRLVEEISALALVAAKEQAVRVVFQLDPSVDLVLVDKIQVQQVLLNLLRNAIEAMENSEPRELVVSTKPAADNMIAVTVADTGPRIDPRVASQLFQPFVTTKRQGMGIGLSISRTIIESHGGQITMEPNPGGGSIFRFTLRAVTPEDLEG
jgi:signal transduction histidine kinase